MNKNIGKGMSLGMVYLAYKLHNEGFKIYSNYSINKREVINDVLEE